MKRLWLAGASLSVITTAALAVPTVSVIAADRGERASTERVQTCEAPVKELEGAATDVQKGLVAVPPKLDSVGSVVNGLLEQVTNLIDLGCLPTPELPVASARNGTNQLPPLPSLPPVGGGLPTVPLCTDLTADLLNAVTELLAALLSTGLPDVPGAVDAVTGLLGSLTKLTDAANKCVKEAPAGHA